MISDTIKLNNSSDDNSDLTKGPVWKKLYGLAITMVVGIIISIHAIKKMK